MVGLLADLEDVGIELPCLAELILGRVSKEMPLHKPWLSRPPYPRMTGIKNQVKRSVWFSGFSLSNS